jgi:hypothetical protein
MGLRVIIHIRSYAKAGRMLVDQFCGHERLFAPLESAEMQTDEISV